MGNQSWGSVSVPQWAQRYPDIQSLIDEHADSLYEEEGVVSFHGNFIWNDQFPSEIHQALQRLGVPYDYNYEYVEGGGGTQCGSWRPGMDKPLEYAVIDGERVFTASQLLIVLNDKASPEDRLLKLRALLDEDHRLSTLESYPDPREEKSERLRLAGAQEPRPKGRVRRPSL